MTTDTDRALCGDFDMMREIVRQRVGNGYSRLGIYESSLRELIEDNGPLDMTDHNLCVVAAVYGEYKEGLAELEMSEAEAIDHGFSGPLTTSLPFCHTYWRVLQEEWCKFLDLPNTTTKTTDNA